MHSRRTELHQWLPELAHCVLRAGDVTRMRRNPLLVRTLEFGLVAFHNVLVITSLFVEIKEIALGTLARKQFILEAHAVRIAIIRCFKEYFLGLVVTL